MAVAIESMGSGSISGSASYAFGHTIGASATYLLIFGAIYDPNNNPPPTWGLSALVGGTTVPALMAPFYNGNPSNNFGCIGLFGIASPPTGSQTITFNATGATPGTVAAQSISFTGAGAAGTPATASQIGTSMGPVTLTPTVLGNLVVAVGSMITQSALITVGGSWAMQWNPYGSSLGVALATQASTGSSMTATFTGNVSNRWAAAAVEIQVPSGPSYSGSPTTALALGDSLVGGPQWAGAASTGYLLNASAAGSVGGAAGSGSPTVAYPYHHHGGHR